MVCPYIKPVIGGTENYSVIGMCTTLHLNATPIPHSPVKLNRLLEAVGLHFESARRYPLILPLGVTALDSM
jgi:hypothetical protein